MAITMTIGDMFGVKIVFDIDRAVSHWDTGSRLSKGTGDRQISQVVARLKLDGVVRCPS